MLQHSFQECVRMCMCLGSRHGISIIILFVRCDLNCLALFDNIHNLWLFNWFSSVIHTQWLSDSFSFFFILLFLSAFIPAQNAHPSCLSFKTALVPLYWDRPFCYLYPIWFFLTLLHNLFLRSYTFQFIVHFLIINHLYHSIQHFIFKFYWSIVDLQCCISFRCAAKWISYAYTYIHSFFPSRLL